MLTKAQRDLHWRLFIRVVAVRLAGRAATDAKQRPGFQTWTKHEEGELRHSIYANALGADKSLTKFNNADFDLVLGAFNAILYPANVDAQLHALNGRKNRKLHGILSLARSMGADRDYVDGIVRIMNSEGKLGSSDLESLEPKELEKVMIALRAHERRGLVHELARNYEERELTEVPF